MRSTARTSNRSLRKLWECQHEVVSQMYHIRESLTLRLPYVNYVNWAAFLDSCTIAASYEVSQAQKALLLMPRTARGASTSSGELNAQVSLPIGVLVAQLVGRRSWRRGQTAGGGSIPRWSASKPQVHRTVPQRINGRPNIFLHRCHCQQMMNITPFTIKTSSKNTSALWS